MKSCLCRHHFMTNWFVCLCVKMSVFCNEIRCTSQVQSICRGDRRSKSQPDLQHPLPSDPQQELHLVPEPSAATRATVQKQTPGSGSGQSSACRKLLLFCHHSDPISRKDAGSPEFLIPVERGSSCRSWCCCPGLHHTRCCLLDQVKSESNLNT